MINILGYCPEVEDVGQETFVRFYQSLQRFRGESSVGTYLTRIAINLSINEIKRRKRHKDLHFSKEDKKIETAPDNRARDNLKELKNVVHTGLQKLKPKYRSVIVLRLIQGYTTKETARILRLPVGTVLSRLARAQMQLKKILTPLFWEKYEQRGEGHG